MQHIQTKPKRFLLSVVCVKCVLAQASVTDRVCVHFPDSIADHWRLLVGKPPVVCQLGAEVGPLPVTNHPSGLEGILVGNPRW